MHAYDIIYNACGYICHQRPERSFIVCGTPLPLCARCIGIYAAIVIVMTMYPYVREISYRSLYAALCSAIMLNLVTYMRVIDTNVIRFIVGAALGAVMGLIILKSLKTIFHKDGSQ